MSTASILDGDRVVPHPAHLGWNLHTIAGTYATVATLSLAEIYGSLSGENKPVTCVKELSDRLGRLIVLFIEQTLVKVYTPQRYQHFPPLALTYSPASRLFGMVAPMETHHDYICYLCAYLIRIENVADVPTTILHPYIMKARNATDHITSLNVLDRGMLELAAGATEMEDGQMFGQAIGQVEQLKEDVSGYHAISVIQEKFADKKLSTVDTYGVTCATTLIEFLGQHGGNAALAHTLHAASVTVMRGLDALLTMATVNENTLTDELLGSMKSKTDMMAREFTELMKPYICVENDIYTWSTVSSMESGAVSHTYPRHITFNIYKNEKRQGELLLCKLMNKLNSVTKIGIDPTTTGYTVAQYKRNLNIIEDELVRLTQSNTGRPDLRAFNRELEERMQRWRDYDTVVQSLGVCGLIHVHNKDAISVSVDTLISICEGLPLLSILAMDLSNLIAVGKALHNVGRQTKLYNAHFDIPAGYWAIVHALLIGEAEHTLQVKFIKKNIDTSFVNSQPFGDGNISPFTRALCEWTALMTKVQTVAKTMTDQMLKFTDFSAENPKLLLSRKLLPVAQYELFANQIQFWNITDSAKTYLHDIVCENLKLIHVFVSAFPDQDNDKCASMRSFTANTDLTYTLSEKDSLMTGIIAHSKTHNLVHDFHATTLKCVNVEQVALTYASDTIPMRVKDIGTLVHYMLRLYENRGDYGCIIHHISESNERVALLEHIVEAHMRVAAESEADTQRVCKICTKYMGCFEVPYHESTVCIEYGCNTQAPGLSSGINSLLASSSVQNNIVANRMLQGADLDNTTVKIEELARALEQHRVYILTHRGETLAWGRHFHSDKNSVSPLLEWREKIITKLLSNKWNVNIRDIIDLHKGVYQPKQMPVANEGSTFFMGYGQESLGVCEMKLIGPQTFPNESPTTLTFGGVMFSNAANGKASPMTNLFSNTKDGHWPVAPSFTGDPLAKLHTEGAGTCTAGGIKLEPNVIVQENIASDPIEVIVDALDKISLNSQQTPQALSSSTTNTRSRMLCTTKDASVVNDAVCARDGMPCVNAHSVPLPLCEVNDVGQANIALTSPLTRPSVGRHTIQNQESQFLGYTARVNPWNIFVSDGSGAGNAMYHLVQETMQLSSSSDGSDD